MAAGLTRISPDFVAEPSEVAGLAERVLRGNWTEGDRAGVTYSYTRPSPRRYPWQWYWDSCFAAIVWRRWIPPARARAAGAAARG